MVDAPIALIQLIFLDDTRKNRQAARPLELKSELPFCR